MKDTVTLKEFKEWIDYFKNNEDTKINLNLRSIYGIGRLFLMRVENGKDYEFCRTKEYSKRTLEMFMETIK